jgi:hypothetical protein
VTDGEDEVDVVSVVEGGERWAFFWWWGEDVDCRFVDDEGVVDTVGIASVLTILSKGVSSTGGRWWRGISVTLVSQMGISGGSSMMCSSLPFLVSRSTVMRTAALGVEYIVA